VLRPYARPLVLIAPGAAIRSPSDRVLLSSHRARNRPPARSRLIWLVLIPEASRALPITVRTNVLSALDVPRHGVGHRRVISSDWHRSDQAGRPTTCHVSRLLPTRRPPLGLCSPPTLQRSRPPPPSTHLSNSQEVPRVRCRPAPGGTEITPCALESSTAPDWPSLDWAHGPECVARTAR
jgi:hypothetical protein